MTWNAKRLYVLSDMDYRIRPFRESDSPMVFANWINSFAHHRDQRIPKDIYCLEQHNCIAKLMSSPSACVLVAVAPEDDNQILGFLAAERLLVGPVLHYVFVKPLYRLTGLAKALLDAYGGFDAYTHHTPEAKWLVGQAVFDPYRFSCPEVTP